MKGVSQLIKESYRIYKKYFGLLAGYIAWLLLPYAGMVLVSLPASSILSETIGFLFTLVQGFLALWLGILIPSLVRELVANKTKIPILELQNRAWRLIPSVIFVSILSSAVVLGGLIMLVIPAFIFWVWFAMAQFSVILENKKGMEAMAWSRELARHRFWPLAWRLIAGPMAFFIVVTFAVGILITIMAGVFGFTSESLLDQNGPLWAEMVSTIAETFSLPLVLIYLTLLYQDLVATKPPSPPPTLPVK